MTLDISLSLTEPEAATEANTALQSAVQMAVQSAPLMMGSVPQPLQAPAQQAVNSLKASAAENVVHLQLQIPGSLVQVLKDNPGLLGSMVPAPPGGQIPGAPQNAAPQSGTPSTIAP